MTTTPTLSPQRRLRRPAPILLATAALGVLLTGGLLAGCGDSGSSADSSSTAGRSLAEPESDAGGDAGAVQDDAAADGVFADGAVANRDALASESEAAQDTSTTEVMERSVISHGTISLTGKDVDALRREVQRVVDSHQGSIADEETDSDEKGRSEYVRLVVRVPAKNFADTMKALEETGTVRAVARKSEDVTTQVIDTDVRVRAQQASLKRVEQLLARASTLKDIVWLESQLTDRRAELDSLRSQQLWLKDQTSLSTITLDIERHETAQQPEEDDRSAFVAGFLDGWNALKDLGGGLAVALGAVLPFVLVGGVVLVPLVWLVRRWLRHRPVAVAPAGEA